MRQTRIQPKRSSRRRDQADVGDCSPIPRTDAQEQGLADADRLLDEIDELLDECAA